MRKPRKPGLDPKKALGTWESRKDKKSDQVLSALENRPWKEDYQRRTTSAKTILARKGKAEKGAEVPGGGKSISASDPQWGVEECQRGKKRSGEGRRKRNL